MSWRNPRCRYALKVIQQDGPHRVGSAVGQLQVADEPIFEALWLLHEIAQPLDLVPSEVAIGQKTGHKANQQGEVVIGNLGGGGLCSPP